MSFGSIAASFCSGGRYQKVVHYYGSHEVSDCPSKVQRWSLPPGPCTAPIFNLPISLWRSSGFFQGPFLLLRQQSNLRNLKCIPIFIQRTLWVRRGSVGLDNLLLFADCQSQRAKRSSPPSKNVTPRALCTRPSEAATLPRKRSMNA